LAAPVAEQAYRFFTYSDYRQFLADRTGRAYSSRMLSKRATLVLFVGLAAAILVFGSVALAAGIRAAESESNGHVQ
jgi:hypothetical protein